MTEKKYPCICEYTLAPNEERIFNTFSGFMLIYVRKGTGTFRLNSKVTEIVPGTIAVMSCLDFLKKEVSSEVVKLTVLEFDDQAFSGRVPEFFSVRSLPLLTVFKGPAKAETILDLFTLSINEPLRNNDIFLRNLTKELIIYTIKNFDSDETNTVYDIKTELAILYIYSHFKESLSIEEVAAQMHYSANYFYHSFQKHTGITFQKFLHDMRLNYASSLLRFTNLTISDICFECGYNSVQYFSTAFRKKFGKSPKNYINHLNTEEKNL